MKHFVCIEQDGTYMNLRNGVLIFTYKGGIKRSVAVSTIEGVLVNNPNVSFSNLALSYLSENGIPIFFLNRKHIPTGLVIPLNSITRQNLRFRLQASISASDASAVWESIQKQKAINQLSNLKILDREHYEFLKIISKTKSFVSSEGYISAQYFRILFGDNFRRHNSGGLSHALNFGYTVLMSVVLKRLVAHGLHPSLGIGHINSLNNVALASDLMEPFRPLIDYLVYNNREKIGSIDRLSNEDKTYLINFINLKIDIKGNMTVATSVIDDFIISFCHSLENRYSNILEHNYDKIESIKV